MKQNIFYANSFSARVKRKLSSIVHSAYIDRESDHTKTVLLCGAPRSGTTWLADVINHAHDYRLIYEPFNRDHVPMCAHFAERQYMRPDDKDSRYLEPARAIFTGRIRNRWIDQYNRPTITRRRLIKDVRSTLMLKWVRNQFPGLPVIFIVRHPCAVAVSRLKLGWAPIRRETFSGQLDLVADHLAPYRENMEAAERPFERHIVDWCVENFVPFSQLCRGDVFLAFYENLCVDPEAELARLFEFLGRPYDESVLRRITIPSITSRILGDKSAVVGGGNVIEGWRKHVTNEDLSRAHYWTALFKLDRIYGDHTIADTKSAAMLLRAPERRLVASKS